MTTAHRTIGWLGAVMLCVAFAPAASALARDSDSDRRESRAAVERREQERQREQERERQRQRERERDRDRQRRDDDNRRGHDGPGWFGHGDGGVFGLRLGLGQPMIVERSVPDCYQTRTEQVLVEPGHYETRAEQVLVEEGRWETRHVPAVEELLRDSAGRLHRVVVSPARTERVWIAPRYETRVVRVWIPPRYETRTVTVRVPACTVPAPAPYRSGINIFGLFRW